MAAGRGAVCRIPIDPQIWSVGRPAEVLGVRLRVVRCLGQVEVSCKCLEPGGVTCYAPRWTILWSNAGARIEGNCNLGHPPFGHTLRRRLAFPVHSTFPGVLHGHPPINFTETKHHLAIHFPQPTEPSHSQPDPTFY